MKKRISWRVVNQCRQSHCSNSCGNASPILLNDTHGLEFDIAILLAFSEDDGDKK